MSHVADDNDEAEVETAETAASSGTEEHSAVADARIADNVSAVAVSKAEDAELMLHTRLAMSVKLKMLLLLLLLRTHADLSLSLKLKLTRSCVEQQLQLKPH